LGGSASAPKISFSAISCGNEIEAFFDTVKAALDLVETSIHSVEAPSLACDLHLQMPDLRHDVSHRGLKSEYARLEVRNIGLELVGLSRKLVDNTPDVAQVLENNIVRFIGHDVTLTNSESHRQPARDLNERYEPAFAIVKPGFFACHAPRKRGIQ
jgi:hypothetical protein